MRSTNVPLVPTAVASARVTFIQNFPLPPRRIQKKGCQTHSAISRRVLQCELGRDRRHFEDFLPAGRVQPSAVLPITDDGNSKLSAVQNSGIRTCRTSFMNSIQRSDRNLPSEPRPVNVFAKGNLSSRFGNRLLCSIWPCTSSRFAP